MFSCWCSIVLQDRQVQSARVISIDV
uniref:Uncharacterized protein n=1 Tax=Arundo donax TaxID=35708 RepID=A0A0A8ZNZ7_ARUDO